MKLSTALSVPNLGWSLLYFICWLRLLAPFSHPIRNPILWVMFGSRYLLNFGWELITWAEIC